MRACMHVCMHACVYACVYACVCVCMHACVYNYACVHTNMTHFTKLREHLNNSAGIFHKVLFWGYAILSASLDSYNYIAKTEFIPSKTL